MTLIASFEISWWNTWILMLGFLLHVPFMQLMGNLMKTGSIMAKMGGAPVSEKEKRVNLIATVIYYLLIVLSVFLPLRFGTAWFYCGIAAWFVGMTVLILSIVSVAKTPTGRVFTTGPYRFSRHPLYLALSAVFIGAGLASASWLFLLLAGLYSVLLMIHVDSEEQECLALFGDTYRNYARRTPRWIGLPKA